MRDSEFSGPLQIEVKVKAGVQIRRILLWVLALAAFGMAHAQTLPAGTTGDNDAPLMPQRPLRPLAVIRPQIEQWPENVEVHGNILPWQESRIGTEVGGLRLVSVLVNVGDVVRKGQVLARLDASTVEVELDAANAQLAEARAALAQATATLERGSRLVQSGGVSRQELTAYETQKQTAEARVNAARAQVKMRQLRLNATTLVSPDDGVISARSATEGSIVQAGSELFRLIRQGRLEWRAEIDGETLLKIVPGQLVVVKSPLGRELKARVRQVSPTVDLSTRNGIAYVDIPPESGFKAGLSVSGTLITGRHKVLVLPATALLRQEGEVWVFAVGDEKRLALTAVQTGLVRGDRVEILSGITERTRVLARAADFIRSGGTAAIQDTQGDKADDDDPDDDD